MKQDFLRINNMVFYAYCGQLNYERDVGQRFEVDVELALDLSKAGESDAIEDTVDVREVYAIIKEVMVEGKFYLVEAIAEKIAQLLLDKLRIEEVLVRVRKPKVLLGGICDDIEVEIVRGGVPA